jgi:uridine phosphorylase
MGLPNFPTKYESRLLFTPADILSRSRRDGKAAHFDVPERMIFCYQPSLMKWIAQTHKIKEIKGFFGDCFLLIDASYPIAVAGNFGIGSPVAVVLLEEYAAAGMRNLINIGLAGGLNEGMHAGDLVLCNRAIRDEGTSYHYRPANKYVLASPTITNQLRQSMQYRRLSFIQGTSWTTDAPFRETFDEAVRLRQEGVLTVEMEASGLFTAGEAVGVSVGAAFSIADSLESDGEDFRWRLNFDANKSLLGLRELFFAAVAALSSL